MKYAIRTSDENRTLLTIANFTKNVIGYIGWPLLKGAALITLGAASVHNILTLKQLASKQSGDDKIIPYTELFELSPIRPEAGLEINPAPQSEIKSNQTNPHLKKFLKVKIEFKELKPEKFIEAKQAAQIAERGLG